MKNRSGILPWTKSCFVCGEANPHGLRLRSRIENDRVVIDYVTRPEDLGYKNIVHGGLLMMLLDEVMTWAAILAERRLSVAAEMTARLIEPVPVGQRLRIEGWTVKQSSRICFTESWVRNSDEKIMARATGKYMPMSSDQARLTEEDFVIGPNALQPKDIFQ